MRHGSDFIINLKRETLIIQQTTPHFACFEIGHIREEADSNAMKIELGLFGKNRSLFDWCEVNCEDYRLHPANKHLPLDGFPDKDYSVFWFCLLVKKICVVVVFLFFFVLFSFSLVCVCVCAVSYTHLTLPTRR